MKRRIIQIMLFMLLALYSHAQTYISLLDGSHVSKINKNESIRDVKILDDGVSVTYNFAFVSAIEDPLYSGKTTLKINGFGMNSNAGEPFIPKRVDSFAVPDNATAEVVIETSNYIDLPIQLSPARPILSESKNENYSKRNVPNIKPFSSFFPHEIVTLLGERSYRGRLIADFCIQPVQYNYETSTTRIYTKISYKIVFRDCKEKKTVKKRISPNDYLLRNTTLNQGIFSKQELSPRTNNNSVEVTKDYLIITVPELLEAVNRFAEWKRKMGYNVIISTKDVWTSNEVKSEAKSKYDSCDNLYCILIVGGHSMVNSYLYNNYPPKYSDFPYGFLEDYDTTQDVYLGRIPAMSLSEANVAIDKIIDYERNPINNYSFYNTGLNCTYFQDSNLDGKEDRRFAYTTERISNYVSSLGKNVNRVYFAQDSVFPLCWGDIYTPGDSLPYSLRKTQFAWAGNASDIISKTNQGTFYTLFRGHGETDKWEDPAFQLSDVSQLNNGSKLPVVFSICCSSGTFYDTSSRCLADSLLIKQGGGAVGIIAATYSTDSYPNDALAESIIESIWPYPGLTQTFADSVSSTNNYIPVYGLGELLRQGCDKMIEMMANGNYFNVCRSTEQAYHCFGDPSMEIRTELPTSFNNVSINRSSNGITVSLGNDSGRITFYNPSTGTVSAYEGSSADYSGDGISTYVCIYGHNRIPYIDEPISTYYIQNETVTGNKTINADVIMVGSNVTNTKPQGSVTFNSGVINLNGNTVEIHGETTVMQGVTLNINNSQ